MERFLLLLVIFGCQSIDSQVQNTLEREYGKGVTLVSYRMVGDSYLDTIRLRMAQAEWDYFEKMARIKADQAKSSARLRSLSVSVPSVENMHKEDALEYLSEMHLFIDSMTMMIRTDSTIRARIKSRANDELKFFHVKGVMMSGDTVWGVYDKDFRVVKVGLQ